MRLHNWLPIALLSLAGLAAGFAAASHRRPAPRLGEVTIHTEPFSLQRTAGDPVAVTESQWLELPMLRLDFDLLLDVELGEGVEFDLVLRRVESRPLQGVANGHHSRFVVLRLSTGASGEPWRSTATALFGERGGVRLAAGMPATVRVEARGRSLSANVAGRTLPPFLAEDDHGSVALIARGGTASVRSLRIDPVAREGRTTPHWTGALVGLTLGILASLRRSSPARTVVAALLWVGATIAVGGFASGGLLPLAQLEPGEELVVLASGVPLAALVALGGRAARWLVLVGLVAAGGAAEWALREVRGRFLPTAELDAVFGRASRETATEALAARIRGPLTMHTLEPGKHRVFLLGGQLLYRRGAAPDQHVEPLLLGDLLATRKGTRPDVDVVALPTEDGYSTQQVALLDRCFRAFAPAVVVLGVPRDEDAVEDGGTEPRSSAAALGAAIERARVVARELGAQLVLLADDGLAAPLRAVVDAAHDNGTPLVVIEPVDAASGIARKLAAVIAPLLPDPK